MAAKKSSSKNEPGNSSPEEDLDPELRRKYRKALKFDAFQSWSEYFSVPSSDPIDERSKGIKKKTVSPVNATPPNVDIDESGNYVLDKKEPRSPVKGSRCKSPTSTGKLVSPGEALQSELNEEMEARKRRREQWKLERIKDSEDLECAICLYTIVEKENKWNRLFGLLPNCDHVFCLDCIVEIGKNARCPVCRRRYFQLIPSPFYVKCPRQKKRMLDAMRKCAVEKRKPLGFEAEEPSYRSTDDSSQQSSSNDEERSNEISYQLLQSDGNQYDSYVAREDQFDDQFEDQYDPLLNEQEQFDDEPDVKLSGNFYNDYVEYCNRASNERAYVPDADD